MHTALPSRLLFLAVSPEDLGPPQPEMIQVAHLESLILTSLIHGSGGKRPGHVHADDCLIGTKGLECSFSLQILEWLL